ncbi:unnamed protein product [Arctia plantaginis]|uniref:Mutator-like transposase domain-containing protein n=1 Tax=Arctia plantaginis TaxID=874455 RepID=A0A8S1AP27_ARCPL|nr:unnamed protein product [Arctia plantaginis]
MARRTRQRRKRANHIGPSGNMEVDAIIQMFQRSLEYFEVMFKNYIGDSDSKSYSGVVNTKPYGEDFTINKKVCIGHILNEEWVLVNVN